MSLTDTEYIELCLNGDPGAFGQLVRRYQAPLLSYLAGRLGDEGRAEDAAQEAFVRSYLTLKKLKKPESFFSWLLGIATRVVKEQQRSERRQGQIARSLRERKPGRSPSHDCGLERAVAELSEPHKEVILLRYYGEMSCSEVAERLDIPGVAGWAVVLTCGNHVPKLRHSIAQ